MWVIRSPFGTGFLYWNDTVRKWKSVGYSEFATLELAQVAELNIPAGNTHEIIEV